MKALFLAAATFMSLSAQAVSLTDFTGEYRLVGSGLQKSNQKCAEYFEVKVKTGFNGHEVSYFLDPSYPAVYKALVNGSKSPRSRNHGEAFSSVKGNDRVTLNNKGQLKFEFSGYTTARMFYVEDTVTIELYVGNDSARVTETQYEGPSSLALGKKKFTCLYLRN